MVKELHIDIETYSSTDIKSSGAYKYCRSVDFEILIIAYALDDGPICLVDLARGEKMPADLREALGDPSVKKYAHNAVFERQCFEQVGFKTDPSEWYCTAIKSAYCGLPLSLGNVSKALELGDLAKDKKGTALIRYFCVPCKPTKSNGGRSRNLPHHNVEKWEMFLEYCRQDVVAEKAIKKELEKYKIPESERQMYILDQKINDKGVELDLGMARNAIKINANMTSELMKRSRELTGLANPNSLTQLKNWIFERTGEPIDSLAKEFIDPLIQQLGDNLVAEVLGIRKLLSKSSIKKYKAMLACACEDNRARGLFQFYGAATGRWAGRLIQLQNLPQNHIKALDYARQVVATGDKDELDLVYPDPSRILSQLIRTALVAKKDHTFVVADFSAIEARVIAWYAEEQWRLDVFASHGKIYEASASMMFNVPIEECGKDKDNGLRAKGKVAELALGYQGAVGALRQMGGEKMGLSEEEMSAIVQKWREANPNIKKFWKIVETCCIKALETGKTFTSHKGKLKYNYDGTYLRIKLPSGRCLFYRNPRFYTNKFKKTSIKYQGYKEGRWTWIGTYGGKLVENIVQATARDLLCYSMMRLDDYGYNTVMHVHDEVVSEEPLSHAEADLERMCEIMSIGPDWSEGLPLSADGYITRYYKKD